MGKRKGSRKSRERKVTATKKPLIEKEATAKDITKKRISKIKKEPVEEVITEPEPVEEESEGIKEPMNKQISGIKQEHAAQIEEIKQEVEGQIEGIKQELEEEVRRSKQMLLEDIASLTENFGAWQLFRRRRRKKKRKSLNDAGKKKQPKKPPIPIGSFYQAKVPTGPLKFDPDERDPDEQLWEPDVLPEEEVKEFLAKIRKEEWKGMDEEKLLNLLHRCNYDTDKALKEYHKRRYVPETWTEKECRLFEKGLDKYGKQFCSIQQMIQTKTSLEMAEFYYVWKKTERYDMFMNSKPPKGSKFRTNNRKKMSKVTDIADHLLAKTNDKPQKTAHVYCTRSMMPVIPKS
ncbi:mesoderm induction early response protein 1 [Trichonephila clavata]|uniref:Mesoderm induction early response protein 1 n=1 Tax=Trichonephila clavata TaxID=2740835 RepID=A0A8X6LAK2_TRICU|nr:mesoderm induction early response protein 1 [Trichonephila clavata]